MAKVYDLIDYPQQFKPLKALDSVGYQQPKDNSKRTITLPCFGIVVDIIDDAGGSVSSALYDPDGPVGYNAAMDALESMVLAHAIAGIDIESPAYIEGIETSVQACANEF